MKFYIINSSPRKGYNTSQLLDKAVEGINDTLNDTSNEVKIEKIDLYDLQYTGCRSCFLCKQKDGPFYGTCPVNDDIKDILEDMRSCDGIILGTPVYFADINGMLRSFIERLCFPQYPYADNLDITQKRMPMGIIYDMNIKEDNPSKPFYDTVFDFLEDMFLARVYTKPYSLKVYNTYQFDDYSKYVNTWFDEEDKKQQRQTQFPKDLEEAYNMGVNIAKDSIK
ncbi:MAG: hypothetical protein BZ136_03310 [Methanosphaera sp. rholeuAM74]|nr:MAG: hypothetical protein BZ136_03310 [Methanosphaera sp. rholeuAM74]